MKRPTATGDARTDAAIRSTVRDLPRIVECGRVETATDAFVVTHKLNEVPDFWIWLPWTDITIFASETLQAQWTKTQIVLAASAAGTGTLFVGKL
jgi:hypothetical protein